MRSRRNGDLAELQTLTASIVEEVRRLMQDLRPSLLDDQGLIPAIRSYAKKRLERSGVKFQIDVQGVKRKLPASMETALFRIFQEAITNIAKHAEAKNGRIELRFKDSSVEAQITDDGRGFDPVTSRDHLANLRSAWYRRASGHLGRHAADRLARRPGHDDSTDGPHSSHTEVKKWGLAPSLMHICDMGIDPRGACPHFLTPEVTP